MSVTDIPSVDVSVVIGSNESLVIDCLDSLLNGNAKYLAVIYVTSNPAKKETLEKIHRLFPIVQLIRNERRRGFAENHNRVLKRSDADYVLVLNDDTVLKPRAIDQMVDWAEANPKTGVIGPKLLNPDGTLQTSIYGYPTLLQQVLVFSGIRRLIPRNNRTSLLISLFRGPGGSSFSSHAETCQVDAVKGACMLVKRLALKEAGYMDEVTYIYEEIEWQYRIRRSGWVIAFLPEAEVIHYGGQTIKHVADAASQMVRANLNFFEKHASGPTYEFMRGFHLCNLSARWALARVLGRKLVYDELSSAIGFVLASKRLLTEDTRYSCSISNEKRNGQKTCHL